MKVSSNSDIEKNLHSIDNLNQNNHIQPQGNDKKKMQYLKQIIYCD